MPRTRASKWKNNEIKTKKGCLQTVLFLCIIWILDFKRESVTEVQALDESGLFAIISGGEDSHGIIQEQAFLLVRCERVSQLMKLGKKNCQHAVFSLPSHSAVGARSGFAPMPFLCHSTKKWRKKRNLGTPPLRTPLFALPTRQGSKGLFGKKIPSAGHISHPADGCGGTVAVTFDC
jgi:hypothetical protein